MASVDESAITGESAPVIRESGGDRSAVTGGTTVLSDRIVVRITAEAGQTFLDRMISLVEGANRQKTPNEIALTILLAVLTIIFLPVVVVLQPFAGFAGGTVSVVILVSLLVCLIPTTIGALLSAIGIAGMDRLVQRNVLAMSGRAVEAAGDVQTLLLDKTGTITLGNRMASDFFPASGHTEEEVAERGPAGLAGRRDARGPLHRRPGQGPLRHPRARALGPARVRPVLGHHPHVGPQRRRAPDPQGRRRGGAPVGGRPGRHRPRRPPGDRRPHRPGRVRRPLVVAEDDTILGVIELKDVVKSGIKERFAELRAAGIRTVMITGDNPLTAAAIAQEAGVDDFLAEATPGEQDGADQGRAGGRQARGHDGRRHQRRARAGPGRRRAWP